MERLTKRINDVVTYIGTENEYDTGMIAAETASSVAAVREILLRLAAYEDTGLTPEEIKAALPEDVVIKLAAQALRTEPGRLRELAEVDRLVREMEWRSDKYINYTAAREKACKGCTSRDGTEGCYSMEPCERLIAEIICAPAANVVPAERAMEGRKDG